MRMHTSSKFVLNVNLGADNDDPAHDLRPKTPGQIEIDVSDFHTRLETSITNRIEAHAGRRQRRSYASWPRSPCACRHCACCGCATQINKRAIPVLRSCPQYWHAGRQQDTLHPHAPASSRHCANAWTDRNRHPRRRTTSTSTCRDSKNILRATARNKRTTSRFTLSHGSY